MNNPFNAFRFPRLTLAFLFSALMSWPITMWSQDNDDIISALNAKYEEVVDGNMDNLYAVKTGGGWEFCDAKGRLITQMKLEQAPEEGYEYYNLVIDGLDCQLITPFTDGKALVTAYDHYAYIDKKGKLLTTFSLDYDGNTICDDETAKQLVVWNQRVDKAFEKGNNGDENAIVEMLADMTPEAATLLEETQSLELIKLVCYARTLLSDKKGVPTAEQASDLFDTIVDKDFGDAEIYQFIVAFYDNFSIFPEKKLAILEETANKFGSSFFNYHLGKTLAQEESVKGRVDDGITYLSIAAEMDHDEFSGKAKGMLEELWLQHGDRHPNMLGRLLNEYDDVYATKGHYILYKDGKKGVVSLVGKEELPLKYDDVNFVLDNLYVVDIQNEKWLVTDGGQQLSQRPFADMELGKFPDGSYYISVYDGQKWGMLNADGTPATDMVFETLSQPMFSFSSPTIFMDDDTYYSLLSAFRKGVAIVRCDGKQGLLNGKGQLVCPVKYELVMRLSDRLYAVQEGTHWGVLDNTGKELLPCIYDAIDDDPKDENAVNAYKDGEVIHRTF